MLGILLAATLELTVPPQKSDAVIGVAALHLGTGKRVSVRGAERFPMGSVYKVPIALTVLRRIDRRELDLRAEVTIAPADFAPGHSPLRDGAKGQHLVLTVRELLRHTVAMSDNTSSDVLLRMVTPEAVTGHMRELGFEDIRIDRSEREMARDILDTPGGFERYAADVRDTATPDEMVNLLAAIWRGRDGLSTTSRDLLLHWMSVTPTGARRLKAGLPSGARVMHKTGTMPGTVNDAGIVVSPDGRHAMAMAIFTKGSKRDVTADAEDDIAAIARAVYDVLTAD